MGKINLPAKFHAKSQFLHQLNRYRVHAIILDFQSIWCCGK